MSELTVRRPTLDDLDAVVELGNAYERVFVGAETFTSEDIADEWKRLDLEQDAWLVVATGGRLAGYAVLEERGGGGFQSDGYVHPELHGRGVGGMLVDLAEARAVERGASSIHNATLGTDEAALRLLEERGYRLIRHFFRMAVELGDERARAGVAGGRPGRAVSRGGRARLPRGDRRRLAGSLGSPPAAVRAVSRAPARRTALRPEPLDGRVVG